VVRLPAMRFESQRAVLISEVCKAAVGTSRYLGYSRLYPPPSPPILEDDARDGRANRSSRRGKDRATQRKGS